MVNRQWLSCLSAINMCPAYVVIEISVWFGNALWDQRVAKSCVRVSKSVSWLSKCLCPLHNSGFPAEIISNKPSATSSCCIPTTPSQCLNTSNIQKHLLWHNWQWWWKIWERKRVEVCRQSLKNDACGHWGWGDRRLTFISIGDGAEFVFINSYINYKVKEKRNRSQIQINCVDFSDNVLVGSSLGG